VSTPPLQRICYVEDDEDIQRIVRLSLERVGRMTVDIVADPAAAIERMIAFKPDLVVLDWMMPRIDGPTLCRRMREHPETRDLPVVFVTAKASPRELEELRTLGAAGTISKPFSPRDLPEQLRAIWNTLAARGAAHS
jgi:CheY-like chemotaxis protein